jgi:hypothetical protein
MQVTWDNFVPRRVPPPTSIEANQFIRIPQTFYLEYRISLGWAGEEDKRDHPERYFKTQQDWLEHGGSKITAAVLISSHLLSRDDAPPVVFDGEGGYTIPPLPEIPHGAEVPGRTRKILIYQEWPVQSRLLAHVRPSAHCQYSC